MRYDRAINSGVLMTFYMTLTVSQETYCATGGLPVPTYNGDCSCTSYPAVTRGPLPCDYVCRPDTELFKRAGQVC